MARSARCATGRVLVDAQAVQGGKRIIRNAEAELEL